MNSSIAHQDASPVGRCYTDTAASLAGVELAVNAAAPMKNGLFSPSRFAALTFKSPNLAFDLIGVNLTEKDEKMKNLLLIAAASLAMPIAAPVHAQQLSPEAREAAYMSCRTEYVARNMGSDDAANVYCTEKYYPENPYTPPYGDPCRDFACDNERPL